MLKKICGILTSVILAALAVVAGVLLLPRLAGYQTMAVLTGSMEPNYHVGSMVYVKEVDPAGLEIGDVITFRISDDTVVTHRIVEINEADQTVTTKGDANNANDGNPVAFANIIGRADMNLPYLGFIAIYARTPIGIGVICGVLAVIILLTFLPEILSGDEEEEETVRVEKKGRRALKKV